MFRKIVSVFWAGLMCICVISCAKSEVESTQTEDIAEMETDTEEDTEEATIIYDEEYYSNILSAYTDETLVEMVVDDFDGDGQNEAFANTADSEQYADFLETEPSMREGTIPSSLWFLSGEMCENIYLQDMDAYIYLEQGTLSDGTKFVMVQDWRSHVSTDDSYYTVRNGTFELLFTLPSTYIREDGVIISTLYLNAEEGWAEIVSMYVYEFGELKPVE